MSSWAPREVFHFRFAFCCPFTVSISLLSPHQSVEFLHRVLANSSCNLLLPNSSIWLTSGSFLPTTPCLITGCISLWIFTPNNWFWHWISWWWVLLFSASGKHWFWLQQLQGMVIVKLLNSVCGCSGSGSSMDLGHPTAQPPMSLSTSEIRQILGRSSDADPGAFPLLRSHWKSPTWPSVPKSATGRQHLLYDSAASKGKKHPAVPRESSPLTSAGAAPSLREPPLLLTFCCSLRPYLPNLFPERYFLKHTPLSKNDF